MTARFTTPSQPTTGPGEPGPDPWEREHWHLADLGDADLLAEVTDDEIVQLLARRDGARGRVAALELELDNARTDLDSASAEVKRWLDELRAELHSGNVPAEPNGGSL